MRHRILAGVLALTSAACGFRLFANDPPTESDPLESAESSLALATPLWSARRTPESIVEAVGRARLLIDYAAATAGTDTCLLVRNAEGIVLSLGDDKPLRPASTGKMLTAAAAFHVLGPDFRFVTNAKANAAPTNGTVEQLWLVGGGDPGIASAARIRRLAADPARRDLTTSPLESLAEAITKAGVTNIPKGIVADDSRYSTERGVATWVPSDRFESGPLGALAVDQGVDPATGDQVGDPALDAAGALTSLLTARGVTVGPPSRATKEPPANLTTLASLTSDPLEAILRGALLASDNYTLEVITREVGRKAKNSGTTDAGVKAVFDTLQSLGYPVANVAMVDGSGLSPENRATCRVLLATLSDPDPPIARVLDNGLPVAGKSGTLANRFRGTPIAGKLRAKTGTLNGTAAFVGHVNVKRPLSFAYIANGSFTTAAGIANRERIASILARFPDSPPTEVLVPLPEKPFAVRLAR